MSQVVSQNALIRSLIEKGIFSFMLNSLLPDNVIRSRASIHFAQNDNAEGVGDSDVKLPTTFFRDLVAPQFLGNLNERMVNGSG
jgi:hypothetical protein